jgi:hypothetical protein
MLGKDYSPLIYRICMGSVFFRLVCVVLCVFVWAVLFLPFGVNV